MTCLVIKVLTWVLMNGNHSLDKNGSKWFLSTNRGIFFTDDSCFCKSKVWPLKEPTKKVNELIVKLFFEMLVESRRKRKKSQRMIGFTNCIKCSLILFRGIWSWYESQLIRQRRFIVSSHVSPSVTHPAVTHVFPSKPIWRAPIL